MFIYFLQGQYIVIILYNITYFRTIYILLFCHMIM